MNVGMKNLEGSFLVWRSTGKKRSLWEYKRVKRVCIMNIRGIWMSDQVRTRLLNRGIGAR